MSFLTMFPHRPMDNPSSLDLQVLRAQKLKILRGCRHKLVHILRSRAQNAVSFFYNVVPHRPMDNLGSSDLQVLRTPKREDPSCYIYCYLFFTWPRIAHSYTFDEFISSETNFWIFCKKPKSVHSSVFYVFCSL